jgi:hypothetical protein
MTRNKNTIRSRAGKGILSGAPAEFRVVFRVTSTFAKAMAVKRVFRG